MNNTPAHDQVARAIRHAHRAPLNWEQALIAAFNETGPNDYPLVFQLARLGAKAIEELAETNWRRDSLNQPDLAVLVLANIYGLLPDNPQEKTSQP